MDSGNSLAKYPCLTARSRGQWLISAPLPLLSTGNYVATVCLSEALWMSHSSLGNASITDRPPSVLQARVSFSPVVLVYPLSRRVQFPAAQGEPLTQKVSFLSPAPLHPASSHPCPAAFIPGKHFLPYCQNAIALLPKKGQQHSFMTVVGSYQTARGPPRALLVSGASASSFTL
jgi:hypothetical protein